MLYCWMKILRASSNREKKKVHEFLEYKSLLEFLLLIYMYISWYFKVKKQKNWYESLLREGI